MLRHLRKSPWLGVGLAAGAIVAGWLYRYATTAAEPEEENVANPDTPEPPVDVAEVETPNTSEQMQAEEVPVEDPKQAERIAAWNAQWFQMYRDADTADVTANVAQRSAPQTPGGSWQLPMSSSVHDPQPGSSSIVQQSRLADPIVLNDYDLNPASLDSQVSNESSAMAGGFHLPPVPDSVSILRQS